MDNSKKTMVLGIVSIALACFACGLCEAYYTGIAPAIAAIITGALAGKEARIFAENNGGTVYGKAKVGKLLGRAGLIVGIVSVALTIIVSSVMVAALAAVALY